MRVVEQESAADFKKIVMEKKDTATLRKSPKGKWNFTLRASNGKVIAFSNQGYEDKSEAKRIIRKYFPHFEIIDK